MHNLRSRTNSPYKIHTVKHSYNTSADLNSSQTHSKAIDSLYSPLQEDLQVSSIYTKKKVMPMSASKPKRKTQNNNQSYESNILISSPYRFSSEADLSHTINTYKKSEDLKATKSSVRGGGAIRKFVLKKIDLQKINNQNRQDLSQNNNYQNENSCSPKLEEQNIGISGMKQIRSSMNALTRVKKSNKIYDSAQTTDNSDDIESAEIIQQFRNQELQDNLQSSSVQQSLKFKSNRPSEEVEDASENESEEEYNIWNNNPEILMRGIDFENFTDSNHQTLYPQVIYKVRSIFYNQSQQSNNAAANNNNENHIITKRQNLIKQSQNTLPQYKDVLEYIPNDKKIQQDYLTLKEFASFQEKRRKRHQERQNSPKKFKNHFIIQMEREKFFQNIQIHQSIQQTPQFINFQQYSQKYRKSEHLKQRPAKYSRYQVSSQMHLETCQSYTKRNKSSSSTQETPRQFKSANRNKTNNTSNFSQFINIENNNNFSPLIDPENKEQLSYRKRCTSNTRKRINLNAMNQVHLYKYINQSSILKQDIINSRVKMFKKTCNNHSIHDDFIIGTKN